MLSSNAALFVAAQFGSRFANSFLTTAVRLELLEEGGVAKFASAQVANQMARVFMQQVSGVLTDTYPLKGLYVLGEVLNLLLILALLPAMYGASTALFLVNIGLGLTQAFTGPVSKSMPPAVAPPEDLALVNSWDLTGDKIGRNLAPMAFTVVASSQGFPAAVAFSLALSGTLVALKLLLRVADGHGRSALHGARGGPGHSEPTSASIARRVMGVFVQVREGITSLRSDRTISVLILNTLATNLLMYPMSSVVFPVIFKEIPEGAIELEGTTVSWMLLGIQGLLGINKKKAWMNYAAIVSLGGVIGPFLSSMVVYRIKAASARCPEQTNWIGLNCGIAGQLIATVSLVAVLHAVPFCSAGARVFFLFVAWGATNAVNNVFTIYFNAHTQHRLGRHARGRFIANILTLFSLANAMGSMMYGWALAYGEHAEQDVAISTRLLSVTVLARVGALAALRADPTGRETVLLRRDELRGKTS